MPDNWSFVIAAYVVTAVVLALYWRSLNRRERDAVPRLASRPRRPGTPILLNGNPSRVPPSPPLLKGNPSRVPPPPPARS
jgi:hypothetical protein